MVASHLSSAEQALPAAKAILLLRAARAALEELSTQAHLYSSSGHRRPASLARAVQRPAVSAVLGRSGAGGRK